MQHLTYRVIIESDERNTFHAYVPALQGCHTWDKTMAGARKNIRDAIDAYLRALRADGQPIPEDRGVEVMETVPFPAGKRTTPSYA